MEDQDQENIKELEAVLYAKIHHETTVGSGDNNVNNSQSQQQTNESLSSSSSSKKLTSEELVSKISSTPNRSRYWNNNELNVNKSKFTFPKNSPKSRPNYYNKNFKPNNKQNMLNEKNSTTTDGEKNIEDQSAFVLKPFRPYESFLSFNNKEIKSNDNTTSSTSTSSELVSKNNKIPKTQIEPVSSTPIEDRNNSSTTENSLNITKTTEVDETSLSNKHTKKYEKLNKFIEKKQNLCSRSSTKNIREENVIFKNNLRRLEKHKQFLEKKAKAKQVRENMKKEIQINKKRKTNVNTIILESSSGNESDEVIEIKVPPPPVVTIDSSDQEEEISYSANDFVKPKTIKYSPNTTQETQQQESSSRCTSPCSVISDDFIRQIDRTQLRLAEKQICTNNIDLDCMQEKKLEKQTTATLSSSSISIPLNSSPTNNLSSKIADASTDKTKSDYQVSDTAAIDIYQSESDLTESIYSKGNRDVSTVNKNSNEILTSSDDNVEEISISQKIKRLRKRRVSSANKDLESNDENQSSDLDDSAERTALPFIRRGEAVERVKSGKFSRKKRSSNTKNYSDNVFIEELNTILKGYRLSEDEETNSSDNYEEISARTIAERVLNKNKIIEEHIPNLLEPLENLIDPKTPSNLQAVPENDSEDLIEMLNTIDNIVGSKEPENISLVESDENDYEENLALNLHLQSTEDQIPKEKSITPPALKKQKIDNQISNNVPLMDNETNSSNNQNCSDNIDNRNLFHIVYSNSNSHKGWIDEQIRFYDNSWGGENFNVNKIRKNMDRNARWIICNADKNQRYSRKKNLKCFNCSDFGHKSFECNFPKKPLVCYMCGEIGHKEPRCPNTICLKCGNKTKVFTRNCNVCSHQNRQICPICNTKGHSSDCCPDRWRRYHSTTAPNTSLNDKVCYSRKHFCCICAAYGHLPQNCRSALRFLEYPITISQIKSHSKSYEDLKYLNNLSSDTIQYNLLYEPNTSISFNFSTNSKITEKQFYGRFLYAVGLEHIIVPETALNPSPKTSKSCQQNSHQAPHTQSKLTISPLGVVGKRKKLDVADSSRKDAEDENSCLLGEKRKKVDDFQNKTDNTVKNNKEPVSDKNPQITNIIPNNIKETINDLVENQETDSSYSFSEHFELDQNPINCIAEQSVTTSTDNFSLEDFIPLNKSYNNFDEDDNNMSDGNENYVATNTMMFSDQEERDFQLPNIPSVAKILLMKLFSEYLLSPAGNEFLIKISKRFNVKASIDWTSVGNVLIIEGLREDQDAFHAELLLAYRKLPSKLNKSNSDSQKVPRKRLALLQLLQDNFQELKQKRGNVQDLLQRLKNYENYDSKKGLKIADTTRRTLNIILFGQAGLQNGKENLSFLITNFKALKSSGQIFNVNDELRNKIDSAWKYIFSSQDHENYEEMVELYSDLKRNKKIDELKIGSTLLCDDQNNRNLRESIIMEQEERDESQKISKWQNKAQSKPNISNTTPTFTLHSNFTNNTDSMAEISSPWSPKESSLLAVEKNLVVNRLLPNNSNQNKNTSYSIGEFFKEQENLENLLNNINEVNEGKSTSAIWSEEAIKYIHFCQNSFKYSHTITHKLSIALEKANKGLLTYNDYKLLLQLKNYAK